MNLTLEQVAEMAPDPASASAGKKLAAIKHWAELGRSSAALWGKCQGSALYQVKVDLANLGYNCTCPSRKFPCKHVLGLLMLSAQSPDALGESPAPEWVDDWLQKRRAREEKQAAPKSDEPKPVDEGARKKRAEQRGALVRDGIERLDLWIKDLVRTGLAGVEAKSESFWEEQAKRLTDSQAPGLASRIGRLASLPRSSPDWAERLLAELGRIRLLMHAFRRIDELDPALAGEVRQLVGWNVSKEELEQQGEKLRDTWVVAGQWVDDDERIRTQRSWVVGRQSGRWGLILQFAPGPQPFAESIVPGTEQEGMLVFYPGALRVRAKFASREGSVSALRERPPGYDTATAFLKAFADLLARQPWLHAYGGVFREATVVRAASGWFVRDREGCGLPLAGSDHWRALAVTGGHPCDIAAEWDGRRLRWLGMFAAGHYWSA